MRLVADVKAYAGAQADVIKQTGLGYVRAAVPGVLLALVALLLALATLPVLVAAIGMTLAIWIGVPSGLFAAVAIVLVIAGIFGWIAARRLAAIGESVR